jgi:hypothetical protein
MWNMNDVMDIKCKGSFVYHIVFDDGSSGDVDFSEYLEKGPVSEPLRDGRIYLDGACEAVPVTDTIPSHILGKKLILACRLSEMELSAVGALRGTAKRKSFPGNIIDYRVRVGDVDVRVEMNRRKGGLNEGEGCFLKFNRIFRYSAE